MSPLSFIQSVKWKFGSSDSGKRSLMAPIGTIFKLDALNARIEALHKPFGPLEGALGYEARHDKLKASGDEAFLPPTTHS